MAPGAAAPATRASRSGGGRAPPPAPPAAPLPPAAAGAGGGAGGGPAPPPARDERVAGAAAPGAIAQIEQYGSTHYGLGVLPARDRHDRLTTGGAAAAAPRESSLSLALARVDPLVHPTHL